MLVLRDVAGDKKSEALHQRHWYTNTTTPNAKKWLHDKVKRARKCKGYISVSKRKIGREKLWDVVVEEKDIWVSHETQHLL